MLLGVAQLKSLGALYNEQKNSAEPAREWRSWKGTPSCLKGKILQGAHLLIDFQYFFVLFFLIVYIGHSYLQNGVYKNTRSEKSKLTELKINNYHETLSFSI